MVVSAIEPTFKIFSRMRVTTGGSRYNLDTGRIAADQYLDLSTLKD